MNQDDQAGTITFPTFDPAYLYTPPSVFGGGAGQAQVFSSGNVRFMPPAVDPWLTEIFNALRYRWLEETRFTSSDTEIALNESYQQIIGLGRVVLPLIFRELQRETGLWFWALKSITREDPVVPGDIGNVPRMREAWLRWGAEKGYV